MRAGCRCPSVVGNGQPALQTAGKMDGGEITRRMSFVGSNENARAPQPAPRQRSQGRAFSQILPGELELRCTGLQFIKRLPGFREWLPPRGDEPS